MSYDEALTNKVREALCHIDNVVEKKMFRGITFMVDGKMCISVGKNELMCRIDPELFTEAVERIGCRPMIHGKRTIKGFVFVGEESHRNKKEFDYWMKLAIEFNKKAKPSRKKGKAITRKQ